MLTIDRMSWPRLYADALRQALHEGYERPSREGGTTDLGPTTLSCPAPLFSLVEGRGGSAQFAELEQLTYLAGADSEVLTLVAPRYSKYREPDGSWYGVYGPRLVEQLPKAASELERHPFTRRAVAAVWKPNDLFEITSDVPPHGVPPCTLSLTFWVGPAGELRCHSFMRSCDLWLGLYYDMPAFSYLQRCLAKALKRAPGKHWLTATSLHLYNKNRSTAEGVRGSALGSPRRAEVPEPAGRGASERMRWMQSWAQSELVQLKTEYENMRSVNASA